jgi:hypothetical protein
MRFPPVCRRVTINASDRLAIARASYEERGFEAGWTKDDPPRVGFRRGGGSFSLVEQGAPTENLHVEFSGGE